MRDERHSDLASSMSTDYLHETGPACKEGVG
jgi:hypothetical protein